jgi:hypothetical protein
MYRNNNLRDITDDQRLAIHRQANMILRGSQKALPEKNDRETTISIAAVCFK